MDIKEVVENYVAHGHRHGFASAEIILMQFLSDIDPDGKCYNVNPKKHKKFIAALKKGSAFNKKK